MMKLKKDNVVIEVNKVKRVNELHVIYTVNGKFDEEQIWCNTLDFVEQVFRKKGWEVEYE